MSLPPELQCTARFQHRRLRRDVGSEFKISLLQEWLRILGVKPVFIYPSSPWEDGYNKRFNGTLRYEVLDAETFYFLVGARFVTATSVSINH